VHRYPNLLFYGRYIDDGIGVWVPDPDPDIDADSWLLFQTNTSYGRLEWEFTLRTSDINFLDLNLLIDDRKIVSSLYEKALNLYLYLPPHSAHAPGMIRGLISGMIYRIRALTSDSSAIIPAIKAFYQRLLARGYSIHVLTPLFTAALKPVLRATTKSRSPLFIHLPYHPRDPNSTVIQEVFRQTLLRPPEKIPLPLLRTRRGHPFQQERLIVAYHRHLNLGNMLSPRKLSDNGTRVSTILRDDATGCL
jgi:hypothetical protein